MVLGHSMEPTLHHRQLVAVNRGYYGSHPLQRGDIVLFRHGGVIQVKRVYALPGQRVWELRSRDGESVFLADTSHLDAARDFADNPTTETDLVQRTVPPGTAYVLGDGGNVSYDSRYYGPIPEAEIMGRVMLREDRHEDALQAAITRATLFVSHRLRARSAAIQPASL